MVAWRPGRGKLRVKVANQARNFQLPKELEASGLNAPNP